jgi:flagellar export protein FliJ
MAKFTYRFEQVKKVKEIFEKEAQREVAAVNLKIENKKLEIESVKKQRYAIKLDLQLNTKKKAQELRMKNFLENYYDEKLEILKKELVELEHEKSELIEVLVEKSKERKIFETLKERHKEQFLEEEKKREQLALDEIATMKNVRQ